MPVCAQRFARRWRPCDRYKLVPVHNAVVKSTEQRQPEKGASLRMTGAQVKEFALCSLDILEPLMQGHTSLPSWKSWLVMRTRSCS